MRSVRCRWDCGGRTPNRSGICNECWGKRVKIRAERTATEAARKARPMRLSAKQGASLEKATAARTAKLTQQLPVTELSGAEGA